MDVTERATAQGYTFPEGWIVEATTEPDIDTRPTDYDCYDEADIAAWKRDEWWYVCLLVRVLDEDGREWGYDILGGCEKGSMPGHDHWIDPLKDRDDLLPEMITEACFAAIKEAEDCCSTWPTGKRKRTGAWVIGHNLAGYLPEADTQAFETWAGAWEGFEIMVREYASNDDAEGYEYLAATAVPEDYPDYETNGYGDDEPCMAGAVASVLKDSIPTEDEGYAFISEDHQGRRISFWLQWSPDREPDDNDA